MISGQDRESIMVRNSMMRKAIDYVADCNPAGYMFDDLTDMYKSKWLSCFMICLRE